MGRLSSFEKARRVWWARDGVAAVEFAAAAPILLLLLAGAISAGSLMWAKMQVGNAARAGATYVQKYGLGDAARFQSAITGATRLGSSVTATPAPSTSCGCPDTSQGVVPATCGSQCPSGAAAGQYVTVRTQTSYPVLFPLPAWLNGQVTLTGMAVARTK